MLCTFTEKAAFEMRDRLAAAARKVGYTGDLSELTVSTIHSFCNRILTQHRHRTELGHSYETLDELTQLLFIFEHFDEIIGPPENDLFLRHWKTRWTAIEGARGYFDKITEELVDPEQLARSADPFLAAIGNAYRRIRASPPRRQPHRLRAPAAARARPARPTPDTADAVTRDLRYVLVDEYQDTNYVQEQLLLKLTEKSRNLCVVGDEDQSLYRFRGATVRNILEFPQRMPGCADGQADDQLPLPPRDRRALRPLDGLGRLVQPARRALPLRQDHRGRRGWQRIQTTRPSSRSGARTSATRPPASPTSSSS